MSNKNNDSTSKWSYLLTPIRDLANNWNIDLANELEDYLSELESITISFDNGISTVDFAEAALLIQGSTCVYSKKVEYLYSLLYQTLNVLITKHQMKETSIDKNGKDKDIDFIQTEFLPLDDIVQEGKNIDLKDSDKNFNYSTQRRRTLQSRTPLSLIALSNETDNNVSKFKINNCLVHESGVLLLEDEEYHQISADGKMTPAQVLPFGSPNTFKMDRNEQKSLSTLENENNDGLNRVLDYGGVDMNFDDPDNLGDDNDYGIDGFDDHNEINYNETNNDEDDNEEDDPWKQMDPHDSTVNDKLSTLKVGKPYRKPSKQMINKFTSPILSIVPTCFVPNLNNSKVLFKSIYNLEFSELRNEYSQELKKERMKTKRILLEKLSQGKLSNHVNCNDYDYGGVDGGGDDYDINNNEVDDMDDDHNFDDINEVEHLWNDFDQNEVKMNKRLISPHQNNVDGLSTFEELCQKHLSQFMESAQRYALETQLSKRVSAWEEKLTPVLQEEEKRGVFDIHEYGHRILNTAQKTLGSDIINENSEITFEQVAHQQPRHEVCRLFLASLQLANTGNIDFQISSQNKTGALDLSELKVQLLSMESNHTMESYRAPSLLTTSNVNNNIELSPKPKKTSKRKKKNPSRKRKEITVDNENNNITNTRRRRARKQITV